MIFARGGRKALPFRFALLALAALSAAPAAKAGENALFGYPHLLPSPYTLPAGTLVYGTQISLGLTDFLQVGTDVIRDVNQIYNANAKLSIVDYPVFALALTGGWQHYDLEDLDSANPNVEVTSWLPGAVTAFALGESAALFVGGRLEIQEQEAEAFAVNESGLLTGAQAEADLSWAYNPVGRNGVGNVLSAGVSYDFTYELLGLGLSHHWPGFQLGVHVYPAAEDAKVLPIIVGGGVMRF